MSEQELPGRPGTDTDQVMAVMNGLWDRKDDFTAIEAVFRILADAMPARLSLRQALAFIHVVHANAHGRRMLMTDVRDYFAEEGGSATVGQSLAKSFQIFFEPSHQEPNGLGWVRQEGDRDDRRKKYLVITPDGAEIARKLTDFVTARGDEA